MGTQMKYVSAYVLLVLGGNQSLSGAGATVEDSEVDKVIAELKGKNVFDVIEEGKEKLSSVPTVAAKSSGGAAPGAAADSKEAAPAAAAEEEEEEEDEDMGFGLFD